MKPIILLLLLTIFGISCSNNDNNDFTQTLDNIEVNLSDQEILIGKNYQFIVSHSPSYLPSPTYVWKSTNPNVATVNESGLMTPQNIGETIIIVSTYLYEAKNKTDSITVQVTGIYNNGSGNGGPVKPPTPSKPTSGYCGARTKDGTPCKRKVVGGGRCWQHR